MPSITVLKRDCYGTLLCCQKLQPSTSPKPQLGPVGVPSSANRRKIGPMISRDLLDILVCPVCKKPLIERDNGASLKCTACRRVYPVRDDIPILLVDEATIDPS